MFYKRPNSGKYQERPENIICDKCTQNLPFNENFFSKHSARKFGLNYVCRTCDNKRKSEQLKLNRAQANATSKAWIKANKASGKCEKCSAERLPNSNSYCLKHWFQMMSRNALGTKKGWTTLASLWAKQDAKCVYTGKLLIPSLNASIDHIKSRAKHPELSIDLNNIQWVDLEVNRMKREHDEEDFIELCRLIVTTHDNKQKDN